MLLLSRLVSVNLTLHRRMRQNSVEWFPNTESCLYRGENTLCVNFFLYPKFKWGASLIHAIESVSFIRESPDGFYLVLDNFY